MCSRFFTHALRDSHQEILDCYTRAVVLLRSEMELTPKFHLGLHLTHRLAHSGQVRLYANWYDESLNRVLKTCCRHISQLRFEEEVLFRMRHSLGRMARKR